MAPKKKGGKKGNDDWDAGLGETPETHPATGDAPEGGEDEESGGLMALMRKNKEKRKKKGIQDDFVQGEDLPGAETAEAPGTDLTEKAPQEASLDDEFALPDKKNKGQGKNKQPQKAADDDLAADGRVLTKSEKEKLKKEREKQRKREQVRLTNTVDADTLSCLPFRRRVVLLVSLPLTIMPTQPGRQEEDCYSRPSKTRRARKTRCPARGFSPYE